MSNKLIQIHLKVVQEIEQYIETLDVSSELGTAKQALRANKQILYKLGYRPRQEKKEVKPARKNPFKKRTLTAGEKALIAEQNKIDNSEAPKDAFKKKEGRKKVAKKIDNSEAPEKNKFKKEKESVVPSEEKKTGPKFKGRLNKERKMKILDLHEQGKEPFEISNELWIDEKAIAKFLKLPAKTAPKKDVVIADNQKEGLDGFIDEVKDSK
jgi:hypothetical protein